MATIRRQILGYVIVGAPKPVVNIGMPIFETGIFDVSASIWRICAFQSLVLLAKQSKSQLKVDDIVPTCAVQDNLLTVFNILAINIFPGVLRIRGGTRAYSYRINVVRQRTVFDDVTVTCRNNYL